MPKRMSCSITVDAVRARRKTVTRRNVDTWANLRPGDRLTLVEKGMGLKKGEKQVVLAEVEIVSNTVEPLMLITDDEVEREGFDDMEATEFVEMWCESHNIKPWSDMTEAMAYQVRRIEWRYLVEGESLPTGGVVLDAIREPCDHANDDREAIAPGDLTGVTTKGRADVADSPAEQLELLLRHWLDDDDAVDVARWIIERPEAVAEAAQVENGTITR